uniref:Outer membrane protein beta-barrel domain-containing protein n=1 Tax=Eiseniibacteriota bacterium TaxID=2212470 RepID=A0A832MNM7_UNCEI
MLRRFLAFALVALVVPAAALAQSRVGNAIGPRVGLSSDPDQLVLGGQLDLGELAPDITFTPNLEFGFGDDFLVVAVNGDLHYHFLIQGSQWRPYVGGGLGINFIDWDAPAWYRGDTSETEVGANLILGAIVPTRTGSRFFTEMKFGIGDIPEFKWLVGWNFGM